MTTPLPVKVALAGAVLLSSAGLADLMGIPAAIASAGLSWLLAPLVLVALIAILIVAGGEMAKARLLEWAHNAEGLRRILARGGWAAFVVLSISLGHSGLMFGERVILAPVVGPLRSAVTRERIERDAAISAESAERQRIAAHITELNAEIAATGDDWSGQREAATLRAERREVREGERDALRPFEVATAAAKQELQQAEAALAGAPRGFSSLTIALPFVGAFAYVAWLLPALIEFLTGVVGWIAAPRRARSIAHSDVLSLDPAGLELLGIDDLAAIGSKHSSLKAKCDHLIRARVRDTAVRAS